VQTTHTVNLQRAGQNGWFDWARVAFNGAMTESATTRCLLTHEFLSLMLGVRRPGVTDTLNARPKAGIDFVQARANHGAQTARDWSAPQAKPTAIPEAEYRRLIGLGFSRIVGQFRQAKGSLAGLLVKQGCFAISGLKGEGLASDLHPRARAS